MNTEPLVTIILPAYNAGNFIDQAVQSVIDQSYTNWELIIINDGSTDGTAAYLGSISHPAIRVIHQQNRGVSAARNAGLSVASGEFVAFLDADDTFPKNSLDVRVKYLMRNQDVQIVGGWVRIMNSTLGMLKYAKKPNYRGRLLPRLLALDNQIFSGICCLIRRDALISEKFDEHMTHCEDLLFLIRISARKGILYGSVNDYIYNYRAHDESATTREDAWRAGFINLIKKIRGVEGITYNMTIVLRFKVIVMLVKWHLKTKTLKNIHQLFALVI